MNERSSPLSISMGICTCTSRRGVIRMRPQAVGQFELVGRPVEIHFDGFEGSHGTLASEGDER